MDSASHPPSPWLHRFALLTALATLALIGIGGLVTSRGVGMSVPDWPTSYGYNMFALPGHLWKGGVFYEHTHRLWASLVGVLVVALTRWLGGHSARLPLMIIGGAEILAGAGMIVLRPDLKGAGHFLSGIGGVVLVAGVVWIRNRPVGGWLVRLGWLAFGLVQLQGLLGGLRVVLFKSGIGVIHAALAQMFFLILCVIVVFTSRISKRFEVPAPLVSGAQKTMTLLAVVLIFAQLLIAATMRHEHAGLAIPDFPLAYGKLWPDTSPESVLGYNRQRIEISGENEITAFQVRLHMVHRILAVVILGAVAYCAWAAFKRFSWQSRLARMEVFWFGLILLQVSLGAATVLTRKAADIATAHVLVGALSLVTGALACQFTFRSADSAASAPAFSENAGRSGPKGSGSNLEQ